MLHLGLVHLTLLLLGLANQATNVRRGRGLIVNRTLYDLEASIPNVNYTGIIEGVLSNLINDEYSQQNQNPQKKPYICKRNRSVFV